MNIFPFFFTQFKQNILQNAPNCTFLKFFFGEHAPEVPNHPSKCVASQIPPLLQKYFEPPPPPPPRNEILDAPL